MFNRYWREYPWYFQLGQYIIFLFILTSLFGGVIAPLVAVRIQDEWLSSIVAQGIGHFGIFTAPALLFAYLAHPRPLAYLGLRTPGRHAHWSLVALITLGAIPVILAVGGWMRLFDFGETANRLHAQSEALTKKMMNIKSGGQLAVAMVVMALLPAVGEELMFRGVLMRFMARRSRTMLFPVALSAVMFALFHFSNPYGLLPIFGMGVLLALVYYWTRSLLCSMVMHFLFNASQILLYYLANRSATVKAAVDTERLPAVWLLASAAVFVVAIWMLWRARTPLPQPGWTADFSPEELAAREEEQQRLRM